MRDAHRERLAPFGGAPPSVGQEPEWAAALVEAPVTDRAELPEPGDKERGSEDELGMLGQPGEGVDRSVDPRSSIQAANPKPVHTTR